MIGSRLVTKQTGPAGAPVSKVLVQQGLDIVQEFYVGFLIDRKLQKPVLIASAEGGMEIEKVAAQFPEKSLKRSLILWPVFPFPKLWKLLLDWTCLPTLPETAQKS